MHTTNPPLQNTAHNSEDEIDLMRLFSLLLNRWYWLLAGLLLGGLIAGVVAISRNQSYQAETKIIVPSDDSAMNLENLFKGSLPGGQTTSLFNEIELLNSYTLNHRVVGNLNWRTMWYEKHLMKWESLYTCEPFMVTETEGGINAEGIDLYIKPVSETAYEIEARGEGTVKQGKVKIDLSATGTFGIPLQSPYFNFTLHRKDTALITERSFRFRFNSYVDLTRSLQKQVNVGQANKDGEVISLSMEGTEQLRAVHYLNELVKVYLNLKLEQQTETQKRSLQFISQQLSGISDSLSAAGKNFTQYRSQNQIIDLSTQGELVMTKLSDLELQQSQQRMQLDYFNNLLEYLDRNEGLKQVVAPSVAGIDDPGLNALILKLSDLYSRREVLSYSARDNNPTLVILNNEIGQFKKQLRETLTNLIDNARLSIRNLEVRYAEISGQLNNLPGKEQQLINIQRNYELTSEIYTFLLQKQAELEITLASTVVDIQVIDPANIDTLIPTGTSPKVIALMGLLLGLFFPAMIILALDFFNQSIKSQEEVERLSRIALIGNVLHSNLKSELVVIDNPMAPITESYRTIRTNLQFKLTAPGHQIIGIHSILPGEGKSFTSANLACILAMNNKRTLLIGADMRKPRLHNIFGLSNNAGLSTYLIGQHDAAKVCQATAIENLTVVASGPVPPNPAELIEGERFCQLLHWAKESFDFVIIDNAPVSLVTDGLITGNLSDLNIFVLRYGISHRDELRYVNDLANRGVMKNPALIMNDVKQAGFGYGYAGKYAYGKGYYAESPTSTNGSNRKFKGIKIGKKRA